MAKRITLEIEVNDVDFTVNMIDGDIDGVFIDVVEVWDVLSDKVRESIISQSDDFWKEWIEDDKAEGGFHE
jgi:hypothetical protein